MGNGDLMAVVVAGFVEKIPDADALIIFVFADDFTDHVKEDFGSIGFVEDTESYGTWIAAVGGVLSAAVIAPIVLLHPYMGRPVGGIFRHGAVVAETDHDRNIVFGGDFKKSLKTDHEGVVFFGVDDVFKDHTDGIVSDGACKLQLPVASFKMFFKVQLLPEGDTVAAVGGQKVTPPQPRGIVVPLPRFFTAPTFTAHKVIPFDYISNIGLHLFNILLRCV